MSQNTSTLFIATRGSALALAQANMVLQQCRDAFPKLEFAIKVIKTTGDKLQTASVAPGQSLPKGLFTKELEVALLENQADLAVHSLKDLPTELPPGLMLRAVSKRADVRDVLIYRAVTKELASKRGFQPKLAIADLPQGATVGTCSTRRKAQLLLLNPGLNVIELRGNVLTRIEKLAARTDLDAIVLAAAGLARLGFQIAPNGKLTGEGVPADMLAEILGPDVMLPCVGQGAIAIETRENDERIAAICERLNHLPTHQCVTAERAFLAAMGGGCQSPVAAYSEIIGDKLKLSVASFRESPTRRAEGLRNIEEAEKLGRELAEKLK